MSGGRPQGLALYDRTAERAAADVISAYSTSFGWASRLLGPRVRHHVRNVYALVRIADEIVDGPARAAGLNPAQELAVLDALERETAEAVATGFSSNLVVHAFARTARDGRIGADLTEPFFASMRADARGSAAGRAVHDVDSHAAYVYGSAEVVGLMCLQVFVHADRPGIGETPPALIAGARRLGAAFQNVNFLRDLDEDSGALNRDYLGLESGRATRGEVLDGIDADLDAAAAVLPMLPRDVRRAVTATHDLFAELNARLRRADPAEGRVRVPDRVKATILARAACGAPPRTPSRRAGARSGS